MLAEAYADETGAWIDHLKFDLLGSWFAGLCSAVEVLDSRGVVGLFEVVAACWKPMLLGRKLESGV